MTTATLWGMLTPLFVSLQIALTQIISTFELLHLGVKSYKNQLLCNGVSGLLHFLCLPSRPHSWYILPSLRHHQIS